jgi:prepilin-type N-terminal cleavage/methylation domain-containing protein
MQKKNDTKGFTLLEILLVVAAIAILAGIVIIAINPGKQLADTRNAQRRVDVNTILNAVYQYSLDNSGNLPPNIKTSATDICSSITTTTCTGLNFASIQEIIVDERYITSLPSDPSGCSTTDSICYQIATSTNGRVTVSADQAEQGETVSVTR